MGFKTIAARFGVLMTLCVASAAPAFADTGDSAWILTATALVLFMTLPGLALFYGGLVQAKNLLSVFMHCMAIAALMSLVWLACGYSIAFGPGTSGVIGGFAKSFGAGMTGAPLAGQSIPEPLFLMFQMTFAIITPALIVGAFAERVNFGAMLIFCAAWLVLCYAPVAHWVWGGGWLAQMGVVDFAGGIVVHTTAGVSALAFALILGKRAHFPRDMRPPHSPGFVMLGAAMLWVGWFGFNAGSAIAANGTAGMAMLVTQIATAAAALGWMFAEWIGHGKPSALGIASGVVAGLVAITPAAGTVGPMGALVIGLVSGVVCFFCATSLKRKLGYDDSLDAFGVHGIGGIVGALLTGIFAAPMLGGFGEVENIGLQLWIQFKGVLFTVVYTGIVTYLILKAIDLVMGLRVNEEQETIGLDLSLHNERGYNL